MFKAFSTTNPDAELTDKILALCAEYKDILTQPAKGKPQASLTTFETIPVVADTKAIQNAKLYIKQVAAATFGMNHNWNATSASHIGQCLRIAMDEGTVFALLRQSLDACRFSIASAGKYPPMRNGKRQHVSLAAYMRDELTMGSPMFKFLVAGSGNDMDVIDDCRATLANCAPMVDSIFEGRTPPTARQWRGAVALLDYYWYMADNYMNLSDANRLYLGKASTFFSCVQEYARQGGWITDDFIGPQAPNWMNFKRFMSGLGVKIP